jgi:hypothetical protein
VERLRGKTEEERVDFKKIAEEAKELVDKRGGTEGLKEDLGELKDIAGGDESLVDKAKEAVEAVKDPGADTQGVQPAATEKPAAEPVVDNEAHQGQHRGRGEHRRRRR